MPEYRVNPFMIEGKLVTVYSPREDYLSYVLRKSFGSTLKSSNQKATIKPTGERCYNQ